MGWDCKFATDVRKVSLERSINAAVSKYPRSFPYPIQGQVWEQWIQLPAWPGSTQHSKSYKKKKKKKEKKKGFKEKRLPVLDWPTNTPDANPIENLWGILKR